MLLTIDDESGEPYSPLLLSDADAGAPDEAKGKLVAEELAESTKVSEPPRKLLCTPQYALGTSY